MSGEQTAGMPISSPGSGSATPSQMGTEAVGNLAEATAAVDVAIAAFKAAADNFVAAGGNPMELMQKFQAVVMNP